MTVAPTALEDLVESYCVPSGSGGSGEFKLGMTTDEVVDAVLAHILTAPADEALALLRPIVDSLVRFGP